MFSVNNRRTTFAIAGLGLGAATLLAAVGCQSPGTSDSSAQAATSETTVSERSRSQLEKLYEREEGSRALGERARGILVFPEVTKAGFVVGGSHGKGTLFKDGEVAGYYTTTAASWGLQAGAQQYGYVLFFMNDQALQRLDSANGWEIGTGPSLVVLDKGAGANITTTTLDKDVYAFIFDQRGLMAGLGLQGSKINRAKP